MATRPRCWMSLSNWHQKKLHRMTHGVCLIKGAVTAPEKWREVAKAVVPREENEQRTASNVATKTKLYELEATQSERLQPNQQFQCLLHAIQNQVVSENEWDSWNRKTFFTNCFKINFSTFREVDGHLQKDIRNLENSRAKNLLEEMEQFNWKAVWSIQSSITMRTTQFYYQRSIQSYSLCLRKHIMTTNIKVEILRGTFSNMSSESLDYKNCHWSSGRLCQM